MVCSGWLGLGVDWRVRRSGFSANSVPLESKAATVSLGTLAAGGELALIVRAITPLDWRML